MAVRLGDDHPAEVVVVARFADLLEIPATVLAVDVPLDLPSPCGPREADRLAREFVGPRRSSVFSVHPRAVIEAPTYAEARARSLRSCGRSISAQAYALRGRILEVDACLAAEAPLRGDTGRARVVEAHPEVSFRAMAGEPLRYAKRTWNGQMRRRRLLADHGIHLPQSIPGEAGRAPVDDVLDAAACAWTARRVARDEAGSFPEEPGRHGVIWY